MPDSQERYRRVLGYCSLACVAAYLLITVYLLAFPKHFIVNKKATRYYRWFALPGPFFREDRLQYVTHFMISYKTKDQDWITPWRNLEKENFLKYHNGFLSYGSLKQSRFERHLAMAVQKELFKKQSKELKKTRAFRELHEYLKQYYLPEETDSVEVSLHLVNLKNNTSGLPVIPYKYKSF